MSAKARQRTVEPRAGAREAARGAAGAAVGTVLPEHKQCSPKVEGEPMAATRVAGRVAAKIAMRTYFLTAKGLEVAAEEVAALREGVGEKRQV